jgi:TonB-linked SusC/RagA family outer membrane protein
MLKKLLKVASVLMILLASLGGFPASAQNRAFNGKVVDAGGQAVIGAAVMVPGTTNGVTTDLDGNFSIRVAPGTTVEISCIGYVTRRVVVSDNMRVILEDDAEMLEETVVIGYGVQKKSDLTGAVASVRGDALKNQSTSDAAHALQGKASGVHVITNGAPGQGASIRVRGYSSNGGSLSPLYIVDGLQVDGIQYIDPSLIESIEVLKDAASAAIYGAQAGNGVVLVTTKTGNEGTASVNYTGKATLQSFSRRPVMNREEFLKYKRLEIGDNDVDVNLQRFDYKHPYYENGVIDQDWISGFMEPSWTQQHSLSFSGGNKNGHFFSALNYVNEDGVVKGKKDVYKRLTFQMNADYQLFKWLQVGTNSSIEKWSTQNVSQRGYTSSFEQMLVMDPLTPVYWTTPAEMGNDVKQKYDLVMAGDPNTPKYRFLGDENGFFANTKYADMEGSALAKRDISEGTDGGFNINGTLFANFMPIKGLTITSRFGYRIWIQNTHSYQSPYYLGSRGSSDTYSLSVSANNGFYYQWENFANYNIQLGRHNITAMAGMSYRESNDDNVSGSASGLDILPNYEPNFRYLSNVLSSINKDAKNSPGKSASLAYFGRLIYSFDNRYSFQANFRADAFDSSKLPAHNRWGYFPSFSAGWTISNEPFFKDNLDSRLFNFLKLRASWGRNGNISVLSGYPYAATIDIGATKYQYNVDQISIAYGSKPSGLPNTNLRWETSEQLDFGLDARLFDNRLTFGVDYFNKQTKDLLFSVSVPPELGVSSTMANGGNVLNTGWEFELGWRDTIGDFSYSVNANFSTLKNKVLSLAEGAAPTYRTDASSTNYEIRTAFEPGYPVWYLNGYVYEGIGSDGAPLYRNKDGEVVSEVGTQDMQYIGQTTPKFTYGVNINLAWRGFDFALYGAGLGGNSIIPLLHRTGYKNNLKYYLYNSQTPDNPNGTLPHPAKVVGNYKYWSSTANMFKGDFFRIKQLQLGYTLPANLTRKAAISNLRFYVSLDDFFTFTKYPGLDPETASTNNSSGAGLDWGSYPTMQKLVLGVNLTF